MAYQEDLIFCAKYPFTKEAKAQLELLKIDLMKIDDDLLNMAIERVKSMNVPKRSEKRLKDIANSGSTNLVNELISYPLAKIIVALTGDYYIKKQLALAESRDVYYFLQLEKDDILMKVASQMFSLEKTEGGFLIPFWQYANNVPEGKENKLANMELSNGFVDVPKEVIANLISKYVVNNILETTADRNSMPKQFVEFADELLKNTKSFEKEEYGPVNIQNFPPCMKRVIRDLQSGQKVAHQPRFVLSTFFANINMAPKKAIEFFRTQPNFNEKLTMYHLEHASGKKGGTRYSVPSCATMEGYGICFKDDTCRWKHPLSYYKGMKNSRQRTLETK